MRAQQGSIDQSVRRNGRQQQSAQREDAVRRYLDRLPLTAALWWFIENATESEPWVTSIFFRLRERVREEAEDSGDAQ